MKLKRILVVDDDETLREALVDFLQGRGYGVLEAADGTEGLALLRSTATDLVILDLMMPGMNGATFRWHQGMDPKLAKVPVIILSSVKDGGQSARVLGAQGYLRKPVAPDALLAEVARVLGML